MKGRCSGKYEQLHEKFQRQQETCLAQLGVKIHGCKGVKVQSLLTYRETVLSEKTEAIFSGKTKALGLAFHGYIYANFRAPAQAQTCLVFGHKTVLRALGELHLGEEEGSLS